MKTSSRTHLGIVLTTLCLCAADASASDALWRSGQPYFAPGYSRQAFGKDAVTGQSIALFEVSDGTEVLRLQMDEIKSGAENGSGPCQLTLAHFHDTGIHGIPVDSVAAYKWATLAQESGVAESKHLIKSLELFMKPEEIELAKKAVAEFQAEAAKKKETGAAKKASGDQ